jgi:hypothetical protein
MKAPALTRLGSLAILLAAAIAASAAEPITGSQARAPTEAGSRTPAQAPAAPARRPGRQTLTTSSHSILGSDTLAMAPSPYVLHPDLVPQGTPFVSSCSWSPAAGETCESECPPIEINLPFGTKNQSNRALTAPGTVKVFLRSSGQLLKEFPFDGLAARAHYMPASIKRLLVRCNSGTSMGTPTATHDVVIETAATEANKNNNTMQLHVGANDQLILP